MIDADDMSVIVEIGLGAGHQIDGPQDEPHRAGIDPFEIDRCLHEIAQLAGIDDRVVGQQGYRRSAKRDDAAECPSAQRTRQARDRAGRGMPAQLLPELA